MEIHFTPEMQSRLDNAAKSIGCATDEFVQKIVATYVAEEKSLPVSRNDRQTAANSIMSLQKKVAPDPEGWTIHATMARTQWVGNDV